MAFSSALTLTDLNDFITPSQACIKPVEQSNAPEKSEDKGVASTQIHIDSAGSYYEVSNDTAKSGAASRKLETAEISLNDCLACSGCITSAESVLITMQSHEEVFDILSSNPPDIHDDHKTPVLSISPQSLASLAASISSTSSTTVTLRQVLHRVKAFCLQLGFEHVYDTTFARHLALLEHAHEFEERKRGSAQGTGGENAGARLPMLASACPGWVCYAEKTHPEMLPFISRTKSPQQVMGTLVKNWLGEKWGKKYVSFPRSFPARVTRCYLCVALRVRRCADLSADPLPTSRPNQIYHVTVMPCYDKKLEASRQDFYNDIYSTRDVDCVITTGELERMMRERDFDLSKPLPSEGVDLPTLSAPSSSQSESSLGELSADTALPELLTHAGTSSGSYLQSLLAGYASKDTELTTRTVRSADYEEHTLADAASGRVLFRGARCYGFRNLQNLVRRVGRGAGVHVGRGAAGRLAGVRAKRKAGGADLGELAYDYVEVMACPGGCVNGGGQLRPPLRADGAGAEAPVPDQVARADAGAGGLLADTEGGDGGASARWGDREWTKRVEQAYWHDLPTPPPSPPSQLSALPAAAAPQRAAASVASPSEALATADALALRVLSDLCQPRGGVPAGWAGAMDDAAETRRRALFRTEYRAVESEVVGIQVQW
ncbi:iron hydrogenase [Phellopilus nigrolimitatus]|nr:iron hydrogenase [Phellopilus nigrolimitatus]